MKRKDTDDIRERARKGGIDTWKTEDLRTLAPAVERMEFTRLVIKDSEALRYAVLEGDRRAVRACAQRIMSAAR